MDGLKKLSEKELRQLETFIKADLDLKFGLVLSLIKSVKEEINTKKISQSSHIIKGKHPGLDVLREVFSKLYLKK